MKEECGVFAGILFNKNNNIIKLLKCKKFVDFFINIA